MLNDFKKREKLMLMKKHLELIIAAAIQSPSGDNCQPFRFKIENNDMIVIRHIEKIAKHYLNYNNAASILSLGAVIESISIQARSLGYFPKVIINECIGSAIDEFWASIQLISSSEITQDNLASYLTKRFTCREPFRSEILAESVIGECIREAKIASSKVNLFFGKPIEDEFISYLEESDLYIWKHKEAAIDFLKMIRFTKNHLKTSRDGLSLPELGVKLHESISLWIMKVYPNIIPLFYYLGLKKMSQQVSKRNYLQSSGLVIFSIDSHSEMNLSILEIGQAVLRTWVYLNSQGYVVQPITTATLLCYQANHVNLPSTCLDEFKNLFINGVKLWRKYFNIPSSLEVVWALRVGLPIESTKITTSQRLRLEEVAEF